MQKGLIKTFTFLDESGVLSPPNIERCYYGIGILKSSQPIQLIQKLHPIHEGLCSALKKDPSRLEFSFKSTTSSSIEYDLGFLESLENDDSWSFACLYYDANTNDLAYKKPENSVERWEKYVTLCKKLIKNNLWRQEETILIADFQRKPKLSKKKFEYISLDIPQVYNILQTESHGVLLIQAVDMLLGGYLYSMNPIKGDKEGNKTRISAKVLEIKRKLRKTRFNCWEFDWSKSSRVERV